MRAGIEPAISWFLVEFISAAPRQELQGYSFWPTECMMVKSVTTTSGALFSVLLTQILSTRLGINKFEETAYYLRQPTFYKGIIMYKNTIKSINSV